MENNPLISVIVPCYNQAEYLDECLQSILDQTYQHWECIIVNDGSPDNTEEIALKWVDKDVRFRYVKKENGGPSSARNTGLKEAKGIWVQFLDGDDLIEAQKFEKSSSLFSAGIDIIISGYRYFENSEGTFIKRIVGRDDFIPEVYITKDDKIDLKKVFRIKNPFVISAPLYRVIIFKMIGGFNEELYALEDWEFNFRCALNDFVFHHIGYLENSKALIRLHNKSIMRDNNRMTNSMIPFQKIMNQQDKFVENFGTFVIRKDRSNWKKMMYYVMPPVFSILFRKFFREKKYDT
ncbi:glycosyltransferase family 2 protein [Elizabethkingia miricola]|uniref:glycosyltransferase family 2 protein n=1 Tax=Elizabethkingia miricola TaxID=172045 RepID=UPI003891DD06